MSSNYYPSIYPHDVVGLSSFKKKTTYYLAKIYGVSLLLTFFYVKQISKPAELFTIHHPRVVVSASCILAEASLQFSCHPSVDMVNHLKVKTLEFIGRDLIRRHRSCK